MIRILTDSACDSQPAEAQQLGVTVIPLNVTLEDGTVLLVMCQDQDAVFDAIRDTILAAA